MLREHIADASVDLIYLDPSFNSKRDLRNGFEGVGDSYRDERHIKDTLLIVTSSQKVSATVSIKENAPVLLGTGAQTFSPSEFRNCPATM